MLHELGFPSTWGCIPTHWREPSIYGNFLVYIGGHQYTGMHARILGYPKIGECIPIYWGSHEGNSEKTMLDTSTPGPAAKAWKVLAVVRQLQGNNDAAKASELLAQGIQTATWDHGRDITTQGR